MKRVILVDDDFIVRTYLKQMISWEKEGYLLVAVCKDGKEALDICQTEKIDIVITDMSMPIMNGMELIRELKKRQMPLNIIVLSCHDDFSYVKEAMKLGIDDYLLKNDLTAKGLLEILNKITPKKEDIIKKEDISTEKLIVMGQEKLQEDFFYSLDDKSVKDIEILKEKQRLANIQTEFIMSNCILINIKNWQKRLSLFNYEDIVTFNQAFKEMLENICQNNIEYKKKIITYAFHLVVNEGIWGILIDFTTENSKAIINKYLQIITGKINTFALRYFNLETICYVSTTCTDVLELKYHWQNLKSLMACSFYLNDKVIFEVDITYMAKSIPNCMQKINDELIEAIYDEEMLFKEKLKGFFYIIVDEKLSMDCLQQVVYDLEIKLKQRIDINWQDLADFSMFKEQFTKYLNTIRINYLVNNKKHHAIKMAVEYINKHYKEAISQQEVAEYIHLNSTYFSTLFKKYMRINFSDYLINYRLDKIKKRLLSGNEKIKEIANDEGFNDYQYFCKLFKRIEGVNPSEYRNKY